MGNLGFQELLLLAIIVVIIVVIVVAVKAASKKNNVSSTSIPIASTNGQNSNQQTVVVVSDGKSVGVAFLLAFLFGPLGLLYASTTGAIVMIAQLSQTG